MDEFLVTASPGVSIRHLFSWSHAKQMGINMQQSDVNTPTYPFMEGLERLQKIGAYGNGIKIGVVDSDVDHQHPLLDSQQVDCGEASCRMPSLHGTTVSSLIIGKNIGIAPESQIIPIPVFQETADGQLQGCSQRALSKAIKYAAQQGCRLINISGSSVSVNGNGELELRQTIAACREQGILIIAAVGNEGQFTESVPASLPHVLAVGACDHAGQPCAFNNYGPKLQRKALLAPGLNMPALTSAGELIQVSGSSFATPIVSGVVALLMQAQYNATDAIDIDILEHMLFSSLWPCQTAEGEDCARVMAGRLHIPALTQALRQQYPTLSDNGQIEMAAAQSDDTLNSQAPTQPTAQAPNEMAQVMPASNPPKPQTERNFSMSETTETLEASAEAIPTPPETMDEQTPEVEPASLELPNVTDPASNTPVHATAEPKNVKPQGQCITASNHILDEKIFTIGEIGYDFGTEARLDYFTQVMGNNDSHPFDPVQMADHLNAGDNIEQSNALIWTLKIDGIPVYAIEPANQFAVLQYGRLVEFLFDQEKNDVERVSIAGVLSGEARLFNGQIVPKISPVLRGMFNWKSTLLADAVMGESDPSDETATQKTELTNFLNRIYYELRNRGLDPHERAINYAATNAYQMKAVFEDAISENLFLNKISAEQSPICRPESDCWDVVLEFFNPKQRLNAARKLYRYTVDVSDIMPVTVGDMRSWNAY